MKPDWQWANALSFTWCFVTIFSFVFYLSWFNMRQIQIESIVLLLINVLAKWPRFKWQLRVTAVVLRVRVFPLQTKIRTTELSTPRPPAQYRSGFKHQLCGGPLVRQGYINWSITFPWKALCSELAFLMTWHGNHGKSWGMQSQKPFFEKGC